MHCQLLTTVNIHDIKLAHVWKPTLSISNDKHTRWYLLRTLCISDMIDVISHWLLTVGCILSGKSISKSSYDHSGERFMYVYFTSYVADADTVCPKKYAHSFCFAVLCCGYTLTDYPISIRLTSLALWQSNDCPSASKATLMNMDKCFMWIHYERLHNHNKAKHDKNRVHISWDILYIPNKLGQYQGGWCAGSLLHHPVSHHGIAYVG